MPLLIILIKSESSQYHFIIAGIAVIVWKTFAAIIRRRTMVKQVAITVKEVNEVNVSQNECQKRAI